MQDCIKMKDLCKPNLFEMEGEKFMSRKQRNYIERSASRSLSGDKNERQRSIICHFKKGDICISDCSIKLNKERRIDFSN